MSIIFLDTETTGLLQPLGTDTKYQPYIVEVCAIRTNDHFQITGEFISFIKPPIPIPEKLTKNVHKISDQMVKNSPIFFSIYRSLCEIFLGCHTFVAHNAPFDIGMLFFELSRIEKICQFPWPPINFCTTEQSLHLKGYRLSLKELYQIATGKEEIENAHRAKNDVLALIECYKWLRKK